MDITCVILKRILSCRKVYIVQSIPFVFKKVYICIFVQAQKISGRKAKEVSSMVASGE